MTLGVGESLARVHDPVVVEEHRITGLELKTELIAFVEHQFAQLVIGACVLAIPIAFTEEVWVLGQQLPAVNIIGIAITSIVFLAFFAYFIFYQDHLRGHEWQFLLRVGAAYLVTFSVAALLLTLFDKCPWSTDPATALKRVVLVTFPASFSATVVDSLR